jgi:hypothetical protein
MGRKRKTSYPIRCWQMLGTAVVVPAGFTVLVFAPRVVVWLVTWRWR